MNIEEKRKSFLNYINTNVGIYNYETIFLFMRNSRYFYLSLQLQIVLLKRIDYEDERKIDLSSEFSTQDTINIKQMTILGIISKLQNLIESTIVFIYSLSNGYKTVNKNMTYYTYEQLNIGIDRIKKNKINYENILAYCDIGKLGLHPKERKIIAELYKISKENIHERILNIVEFYEKFKYVHEKFKHGLNIIPGLHVEHTSNNPNEFDKSILLSRTKKKIVNKENFLLATTEDISPNYNITSRICFGDKLEKLLFKTMRELDELINYICSNHIIKAINCGEGYLPFDINDLRNQSPPSSVLVKFFGKPESFTDYASIKVEIAQIINKIVNNMNHDTPGFQYNDKFTNAESIEDMYAPILNILFKFQKAREQES